MDYYNAVMVGDFLEINNIIIIVGIIIYTMADYFTCNYSVVANNPVDPNVIFDMVYMNPNIQRSCFFSSGLIPNAPQFVPDYINPSFPSDINRDNSTFPQYFGFIHARPNKLLVGKKVKFNNFEHPRQTGDAIDITLDVPAAEDVIRVGMAGGATDLFSSRGRGTYQGYYVAGDKEYTFSDIVRRLKDIGILPRGAGYAPE